MIIRRIDKKPAACDTPAPDSPLSAFDVFAQTWAEHYPFFAATNVDWPAIVAANRSRVSETTTPEALFAILAGIIAPLQDAHSGLAAGENTQDVFSDVLDRRLPNGCEFGLANERFVTKEKSYDVTGVPPDVAIESFTPAAGATGKDAAVAKALEMLGGR